VKLRASLAVSILAIALTATGLAPSQAVAVPSGFVALSNAAILNHPGIILLDSKNNEIVYESNPDVTRAPASVLKLVSTTSALKTFGPDKTFATSISATEKPNKFVLVGEGDPWLSTSKFEAAKYKRAFLPYLINKALAQSPHIRSISLMYKNIYYQDIQAIQRYYKGRIKIYPHPLPQAQSVEAPIATITSPTLRSIIEFTLLWSDNLLAARMSLMAAKAEGFSADSAGIQASFEKLFSELGIPAPGLVVKDGAGLSHDTRISARTIAELLLKIRNEPTLESIYVGLPVAGISGTLKNRFTKDAPAGVGLVKAKTGWINTTVSLAGFVSVGDSDYVFAVIADHVANRESVRQGARVAIDKMLATIARPMPGVPIPTSTPDAPDASIPITND
jgi:D-alanyl-D-alanine carboxypeptidase